MTSAPTTARAEADRCPGVLRPHRAADGALLRLRLPGGRVSAAALAALSAAAQRYADGDIQLTSRANLQLRGVATGASGAVAAGLVDDVVAAGFLPQPSHERIRNIVCSPLTGLLGGRSDLRGLTRLLDEKLCAAVDLANLPGPFLFVLDDGRRDVIGLKGDLGVCAVGAKAVRVRVGAFLVGPALPHDAAADALIDLAARFLPFTQETDGSRPVWHVRELPLGGRELLPSSWEVDLLPSKSGRPAQFGGLRQDNGLAVLSVLVPLGLLTGDQAAALVLAAEGGNGELIVTPWRSILVPGLPPSTAAGLVGQLSEVGLELTAEPSWRGITACTGAPRCAHGVGETRPLAAAIAGRRAVAEVPGAGAVHVVGCERRCGSPNAEHIEVLNLGAMAQLTRDGSVVEVPTAAVPSLAGVGG
ncbi:MAG: cobalamin biosynthesis protein CobG [Nakamurella sp.]